MLKRKYRQDTLVYLLVAVFAANWLLTPFLFANHEHVWCNGHQQFERFHHNDAKHNHDFDHADHDNESFLQDFSRFSKSSASFLANPEELSHPHDACHVLAQLYQTANASFLSTHLNHNHLLDGFLSFSEQLTFAPISCLSMAPKNSPPVA